MNITRRGFVKTLSAAMASIAPVVGYANGLVEPSLPSAGLFVIGDCGKLVALDMPFYDMAIAPSGDSYISLETHPKLVTSVINSVIDESFPYSYPEIMELNIYLSFDIPSSDFWVTDSGRAVRGIYLRHSQNNKGRGMLSSNLAMVRSADTVKATYLVAGNTIITPYPEDVLGIRVSITDEQSMLDVKALFSDSVASR